VVGAVLAAAAYQLTPLKRACLRRCRTPLGALLRHDAFRGGLEHGAACFGCCWALMLAMLEKRPDRAAAIAVLAEGFDMLEEDLDKERFFSLARKTYWESAEGSPARGLMQTLIGKLDF